MSSEIFSESESDYKNKLLSMNTVISTTHETTRQPQIESNVTDKQKVYSFFVDHILSLHKIPWEALVIIEELDRKASDECSSYIRTLFENILSRKIPLNEWLDAMSDAVTHWSAHIVTYSATEYCTVEKKELNYP